jgi:hypothetical protein
MRKMQSEISILFNRKASSEMLISHKKWLKSIKNINKSANKNKF